MVKYKYINEYQVETHIEGNFIVFENRIYTNPRPETLLKAGYKDMVIEPEPEYDHTTKYIIPKYIDGETTITQTWEIIDNTGSDITN